MAKPQVHIHRFGASLNGHVHFHVCALDGVFEDVPGEGEGNADATGQAPAQGIVFHPASAIDEAAVAQVQADLRRRILRAPIRWSMTEPGNRKAFYNYTLTLMHGPSAPNGETTPRDERAASSAAVELALPGHWVRPLEGGSAAGATGVGQVHP